MGAMMGSKYHLSPRVPRTIADLVLAGVGLTIGFIFGGFSVLRYVFSYDDQSQSTDEVVVDLDLEVLWLRCHSTCFHQRLHSVSSCLSDP
jgi:hypothetical protein